MSQVEALTDVLQAELAPILQTTAAEVAALLGEIDPADPSHSLAAQVSAIPNIGLLLRALEGKQITTNNVALDFGTNNNYRDVTVGDVALGSILKLSLHVHVNQPSPLISSVEPLERANQLPLFLAGGNSNGSVHALSSVANRGPRPGRMLIFDGQTQSTTGSALRQSLLLRGIEVIEPPPLTSYTITTLGATLDDVDAAVVVLSPAICATTILREVELPASWARYGRSTPFILIPVLEDVGSNSVTVAESAMAAIGAQLKDFRVLSLPEAGITSYHTAINTLAGLMLRSLSTLRLRASVEAGKPIALTIFSYPPSGTMPPADLALAWVDLFPEPDHPTRRPPSPQVWSSYIDPALSDVRRILGVTQVSILNISGRYHLSVGLALGFRFRAVAGMVLQVAAQPGGTWRSHEVDSEGELLQSTLVSSETGGRDLSVEVSLARDVRDDADRYLREHHIAVARRIQLTSKPLIEGNVNGARAFVTSPAHAARLVEQIANIILSHGTGTIHLFAAIPQALAVLIGTQLNKARPVQCYEIIDDPDDERIYEPSCTLR